MRTIERATQEDVEELAALYDSLHDHLAANGNYPGWRKGVYPAKEDAEAGLLEGGLCLARVDGVVAGSLLLSQHQDTAYHTAPWSIAAPQEKVYTLRTFVVHPRFLRCGIGGELLDFAKDAGRRDGKTTLRLDVYEKNLPAIRLYEKKGFRYVATVDLGLGEYGLDAFCLYELQL